MPQTPGLPLDDPGRSLDDPGRISAFIADLIASCPERAPTSDDEARAQRHVAEHLRARGLDVTEQEFRFNRSLYQNLLLHFGLATAATALAGRRPRLAAALHGTIAASYLLDSLHRAFVLRRLLPWGTSRNVVGVLPSKGEPALRIVIVTHTDAAFTGFIFEPRMASQAARGPIKKPMAVATASVAAQAVLAGWRAAHPPHARAARAAELLLAVPPLLTALANLDVVLRDRIVPGANDNLSGVAGMLVLAERLRGRLRDDVEVVFVATGAEEASLGGATALAEAMHPRWSTRNTVVLALDGLSNGELRYFVEGEVVPLPLAGWLRELLHEVAATDPRFATVAPFVVPVGGSDVCAFVARGYDGVCIGRIDPRLGAPREYHLPTDTADRLDPGQVLESIDFVEALVHSLIARRLGRP
jgi:hypothetical protein